MLAPGRARLKVAGMPDDAPTFYEQLVALERAGAGFVLVTLVEARGSVPQGAVTADPLPLSVKDAVNRALQFNLGLLLQEEAVKAAHGARLFVLIS